MKILATGANGQLGFDVLRAAKSQNIEVTGADIQDFDITNLAETRMFITKHNPTCVIHCAAYTAVDLAEDEREKCHKINVTGTKNIALACKEIGAKMIYISTDYVFDGEGEEPFKVDDIANPVNYYGLTKFQGEQAIAEILQNYFIARISWVYGINGNNFVKTMLKLAENRDELNIVGDQIGSPTYTLHLAPILLDMAQSDKYGIYHITGEGFCSWANFASEVFNISNKQVKVNPIPSSEFPTKAKRPKNSRLNKSALDDYGFTRMPDWQESLKYFIKNEL